MANINDNGTLNTLSCNLRPDRLCIISVNAASFRAATERGQLDSQVMRETSKGCDFYPYDRLNDVLPRMPQNHRMPEHWRSHKLLPRW